MTLTDNQVPFNESEYRQQCASIDKSVKYLVNAFNRACQNYRGSNAGVAYCRLRDSQLNPIKVKNADYTLLEAQVEFAWLIHEIQTGPILFAQDHIHTCNELIDSLSSE